MVLNQIIANLKWTRMKTVKKIQIQCLDNLLGKNLNRKIRNIWKKAQGEFHNDIKYRYIFIIAF
jgi:hypothetical protein